MTDKPNTTKPNDNRPKGKGKPKRKRVRTIGTNVGQAVKEALAAQEAEQRRKNAAAAARIAGRR